MLDTYFKAEKYEALLFLVIGALGIAFILYTILKIKLSFYNGLAIPFILLGLIQIVVGGSVFFRTDKQLAHLKSLHETNPKAYVAEEVPRMKAVNRNFVIYRYTELAFVVVGLALALLLRQNRFWFGLGLGMLIQGGIMLSLDFFAERRGRRYEQFVQTMQIN